MQAGAGRWGESANMYLSELRFTSDLDSTGTLLKVLCDRLPDSIFRTQWVKTFEQDSSYMAREANISRSHVRSSRNVQKSTAHCTDSTYAEERIATLRNQSLLTMVTYKQI